MLVMTRMSNDTHETPSSTFRKRIVLYNSDALKLTGDHDYLVGPLNQCGLHKIFLRGSKGGVSGG